MRKRSRTIQKKFAILALSLLLALPLLGNLTEKAHAADDSSMVIHFPDANLKKALLDLGIDKNKDGQITRGELAERADLLRMGTGLASLPLEKRNIKDLTGLEYAVNVRNLMLDGNPVTDLSPVAGMVSLETVSLNKTQVKDLSPLGKLPGLRFLTISDTSTLDIRTISSLSNLEYLFLRNSNIRDITPIARLTKLRVLDLFNNQVADISPLANLTSLDEVNIRANNISDISALSNKPILTMLYASYNQITDVRLSNLPNLKMLELDMNKIRDISALAAFTKLELADLSMNEISDISPLSGLTKLEYLYLYDNKIDNITPLAGLTKLIVLELGKNRIRNTTPIAGLNGLSELGLSDNPLGNVEAIQSLTNLTGLSLANNNISDIRFIGNLSKLTALNLEKNKITDISPLGSLKNLRELFLQGNMFKDASILSTLPKLTRLNLEHAITSSNGPAVSGVSRGFYNTDLHITFDRGTATLNNKPFTSGTTVSEEGHYHLFVREPSGLSTSIHFIIDKQPPVVQGVTNGTTYGQTVTYSFNEGTATLNGRKTWEGDKIDKDGAYTLVVTDEAGNSTTVNFNVLLWGPLVRGVSSGGLYNTNKVITFDQGSATLNGEPFKSGDTVSDEGTHTLVVTGRENKVTTVVFTIRKNSDEALEVSKLRGVSGWAKPDIQVSARIGLTLPVQDRLFSANVTREQFSAIAIRLYEALTGKTTVPASPNPFTDTSNPDVLKAYKLGIVKGTDGRRFSPDALITREQLALMLMRVLEQSGKALPEGKAKTFTDRNRFSSYAVSSIDYLSSADIISGLTATTFEPKRNATIEQAIIMAKRAYELLEKQPATGNGGGTAAPNACSPSAATEGSGNHTLYTFDGSAFELYVKKSHPQPDGSDHKEYAVRNQCAVTLPAYSAVYITAGHSVQNFEDEYYNYNYGGYLLVANHTDKPVVIKPGAVDYEVKRFFRDDAGTMTLPDGTSQKLTSSGPYVRLLAFDGDFDESKPYKTYFDDKKDLYRGDWMTVKPRKS